MRSHRFTRVRAESGTAHRVVDQTFSTTCANLRTRPLPSQSLHSSCAAINSANACVPTCCETWAESARSARNRAVAVAWWEMVHSSCHVTVNPACTPVSYAAQPANTTITQGQGAQVSVVASGTGPFTYQWYQLTNNGSVAVGTNSSVLTISPAQTSQYFVWTYNNCGQMASNVATVAPAGPPPITIT